MDYIGRGEHDEFVKRMEEEHTRQNKRIGNLEKAFEQQNKLALSVEKMATNMEHMLEEQMKQGKKLEELEKVPAKKWNTVTTAILSAIGGAIGTGIIAGIIHFM
jgi:predicted  nucleic acid-binding Zn-ribbon protein